MEAHLLLSSKLLDDNISAAVKALDNLAEQQHATQQPGGLIDLDTLEGDNIWIKYFRCAIACFCSLTVADIDIYTGSQKWKSSHLSVFYASPK